MPNYVPNSNEIIIRLYGQDRVVNLTSNPSNFYVKRRDTGALERVALDDAAELFGLERGWRTLRQLIDTAQVQGVTTHWDSVVNYAATISGLSSALNGLGSVAGLTVLAYLNPATAHTNAVAQFNQLAGDLSNKGALLLLGAAGVADAKLLMAAAISDYREIAGAVAAGQHVDADRLESTINRLIAAINNGNSFTQALAAFAGFSNTLGDDLVGLGQGFFGAMAGALGGLSAAAASVGNQVSTLASAIDVAVAFANGRTLLYHPLTSAGLAASQAALRNSPSIDPTLSSDQPNPSNGPETIGGWNSVASEEVNFSGATENFVITTPIAVASNEYIRTGAGNDRIVVGGGIDTVIGGDGDDLLIVNYSDATQQVYSNIPAGIVREGNVRQVAFNGIERFDIRSGSGDDEITTSSGDDVIRTGAGNDYIDAGLGADIVDGGEGNDAVIARWASTTTAIVWNLVTGSYSGLGAWSNVEWFSLLQTGSGDDRITTSDMPFNDYIHLGAGNDIASVSRGGIDSVIGGDGDDLLIVNYSDATQQVYSNIPAGIVREGNIRQVAFNGVERFDIHSGSGDDEITTSSGDDVIRAGAGNDYIDAGLGADIVDGGAGNDNLNSNAGDDTIYGGEGADTLTGGAGNDYLDGGSENDTMSGDAGNDLMIGGAGGDTMSGGAGNDQYLVDSALDQVIEAVGGGANDIVFTQVSYALGSGQEVEELAAANSAGAQRLDLTGNAFANRLYGNNGLNVIIGGAGADLMAGFGGNDQYLVDNAGDRVLESAGGGDDIVFTTTSFGLTSGQEVEEIAAADGASTARLDLTGNELANRLYGNDGLNVMIGGAGADLMAGFGGDDQYLVDNVGDSVLEFAGGGDDIVFTLTSFALTSGVEVEELSAANSAGTARLDLTGNEFANRLYGNDGVNVMIGGGGADLMNGFGGDDQYLVDDAGDQVAELADGGTDIVFALTGYTLGAGAAVEQLVAASPGSTSALNLFGNEFANAVYGNNGANVLAGREGSDTLNGYNGADAFVFDTALAGAGIDRIADFETGIDKIALDDTMFGGLAAVTAANFVLGSQAQDGDDRIIFNAANGALLFDADGNGAGAAIQFAILSTGLPLNASDFVVI